MCTQLEQWRTNTAPHSGPLHHLNFYSSAGCPKCPYCPCIVQCQYLLPHPFKCQLSSSSVSQCEARDSGHGHSIHQCAGVINDQCKTKHNIHCQCPFRYVHVDSCPQSNVGLASFSKQYYCRVADYRRGFTIPGVCS